MYQNVVGILKPVDAALMLECDGTHADIAIAKLIINAIETGLACVISWANPSRFFYANQNEQDGLIVS